MEEKHDEAEIDLGEMTDRQPLMDLMKQVKVLNTRIDEGKRLQEEEERERAQWKVREEEVKSDSQEQDFPNFDQLHAQESAGFAFEQSARQRSDLRRQSILANRTRQASDLGVIPAKYAIQPEFKHIKLSRLRIKEVFEFTNQVIEYQTAHRTHLPVPTLIDAKVRRHLIASNKSAYISERQFYELNMEELFTRIRKEISPSSKLDFVTLLQANVSFQLPDRYKPTPTHFNPMYHALLAFRTDFISIYELLAEDNDLNIPDCKNKEGGLLKIFLDKIPFEYGKRTFQSLATDKFEDLYKFLTAFYKQVQSDEDFARNARQLNQKFGGTEWEKSL